MGEGCKEDSRKHDIGVNSLDGQHRSTFHQYIPCRTHVTLHTDQCSDLVNFTSFFASIPQAGASRVCVWTVTDSSMELFELSSIVA
jgi:hypothetical protein